MASNYNPEIYDRVTPATVLGDVEFYCNLATATNGPVLELGAGTGRITLELARRGVDITALDSNADMLTRLKSKLDGLSNTDRAHVSTIEGDMRSFRTDRRFSLIIAPFRAFLHNLTLADQRACAIQVSEHLLPGGTFALNVFHPSLTYMAQNAGSLAGVWRQSGEWILDNGDTLIESEANSYDTVRKLVHSRHRYDRFAADGTALGGFLQRLELAYLYPSDLMHLLADAGFSDIKMFGGFDGRPLANDQDELVTIAKRQ
ncbi:MAG TPA: class I SAM-dependent methyltransferase [Pyrinomonadaceae bacterium]|nr:class I SAM-dependent methyltransferase [Pyrinomonadaceae bacterium]